MGLSLQRDLNDVLVFMEVVSAGSFTAAGRELGVPTSTVSRRVSRLEEALGILDADKVHQAVQEAAS